MTKFTFSKGLHFQLEGRRYKLSDFINGSWHVMDINTKALQTLKVDVLMNEYISGRLTFPDIQLAYPLYIDHEGNRTAQHLDLLPELDKKTLKSKRIFLENYLRKYGDIRSRDVIRQSLEQDWDIWVKDLQKPSVSTAYRWLVIYLKSNKSILSLMPRRHNQGNRKQKIAEVVMVLCLEAIEKTYLQRNRGTKSLALKVAASLVNKENQLRPADSHLAKPTMSTIKRIIGAMDPFDVYASRYGVDAARHKFRISIGRQKPNEKLRAYQIDHTALDCIVIDKRTGIPIGRPFLTLVVDEESAAIPGYHLSFDPPAHASVAAALKMAVLPKTVLNKTTVGLMGSWNVYGIPDEIVVDNGLEFHGMSLEAACEHLGISIRYCPRKTPWYKGRVERLLRSINRAVGELVPGGRTFGSVAERGDYNSNITAKVTLEMLHNTIIRWIVDVYHEKHHRGLDTTPRLMWERCTDPEELALPINPEELDAITGNIDYRKVWHYGIELNNLLYNSHELGALRNTFGHKKIPIRWNTSDMGKVYVLLPDGSVLPVPVVPSHNYAVGLSYYAFQATRQYIISQGNDPRNEDHINEALLEIRNDLEISAKGLRKEVSRRKQRLREGIPTPQPKSSGIIIAETALCHEKSGSVPYTPSLKAEYLKSKHLSHNLEGN